MNFVRDLMKQITEYPMTAKITNPIVTSTPQDMDTIIKNSRYIPEHISEYIKQNTKYCVSYRVEKAEISFYVCKKTVPLQKLNKYVKLIQCWINIAHKYSIHSCNSELKVKIYLTPFKKTLPEKSSTKPLSADNSNTGLSSLCKYGNEIIVYREEEWFKVFLHESFHYFGFDYSGMDISIVNDKLQKCFCIDSDIRLFETYTEFFAEIVNLCFYCVINRRKFSVYIRTQISFSIAQLNKVLKYNGLTYVQLFENCEETRRKYREDTNVFAYYVLKCILIFHWDEFIEWCNKRNVKTLTFPHNSESVVSFCDWIIERCRDPKFLQAVELSGNKRDETNGLRMTSIDVI